MVLWSAAAVFVVVVESNVACNVLKLIAFAYFMTTPLPSAKPTPKILIAYPVLTHHPPPSLYIAIV